MKVYFLSRRTEEKIKDVWRCLCPGGFKPSIQGGSLNANIFKKKRKKRDKETFVKPRKALLREYIPNFY